MIRSLDRFVPRLRRCAQVLAVVGIVAACGSYGEASGGAGLRSNLTQPGRGDSGQQVRIDGVTYTIAVEVVRDYPGIITDSDIFPPPTPSDSLTVTLRRSGQRSTTNIRSVTVDLTVDGIASRGLELTRVVSEPGSAVFRLDPLPRGVVVDDVNPNAISAAVRIGHGRNGRKETAVNVRRVPFVQVLRPTPAN
jgi:hypothetical protein